MPNRLKPSVKFSVFRSHSNYFSMKKILFYCLVAIFTFGCKSANDTATTDQQEQAVKLSNNPADFRARDKGIKKPAAPVEKRMPDFVPEAGKKNWFAVYSEHNTHVNGIFKLPTVEEWADFMSTMHYAEMNEIYESMPWQTTEEWWTKRDIMSNVKSRNLMAYKREDNTGSWYFAFNPRNYEVYFWR